MDVRLPDGTIVTNVPESITQTDLMARLGKQNGYERTAQSDPGVTNFDAAVGGMLSGIPIAARQIMGNERPGEYEDWKKSMSALWNTTGGKIGSVVGGALPAVPAMFIPGANTAVGAGLVNAGLAALQPADSGMDRLKSMGISGGLGAAAQFGLNKVGGMLADRATSKAAELAAEKTNNAVRDETIRAAQDAGYVFPPAQVNPSTANRALEGFAGKLTTAQNSSAKNQALTNTLAKSDIGIPENVPLTKEAIEQARTPAYKVYEELRGFGTLAADKDYANDLYKIAEAYDKAHGGMKSLRNSQVEALLEDASKTQIDTNNAVELLRNLREQGFGNIGPLAKAADKSLGRTQLKIADAIEGLIDRNLEQAGNTTLLSEFRAARTHLAKTYTVEKALNEATGNVRANVLARDFQKGRPLSGGLETIGKTASAFPKATAEITTSLPQVSPLDFTGALLTGTPLAALARPIARSAVLSAPYQKAMVKPPSYEMGIGSKLPSLLEDEWTRLLGSVVAPSLLRHP